MQEGAIYLESQKKSTNGGLQNFDPLSAFDGRQLAIFESWLCAYALKNHT